MNASKLCALSLCAAVASAAAAAPATYQRFIGTGVIEEGGAIGRTRDGGSIIAGVRRFAAGGFRNIVVIKLDYTGATQWEREVIRPDDETPLSIMQTSDGGYALVADVTNEASVRAMIATAAEALDGIDVLVNNAGIGGTAEVHEMTDEQWSLVLDVTLTGTFRVTRAALAHMYPRGRGVIVNNASVLGWRAQGGQAHYAAAKAGVMAFTRCTAIEAAARGVRINAVAPSLAMHANLAKVTSDELLAELTAREAFGRAAEPWEIANVIVFLASEYSSYMTGEVISVSSQHA